MSLAATLLNPYQAAYMADGLDKYNNLTKGKLVGLWNAFVADTNSTLKGLENDINRTGQPQLRGVEIPVLDENPEAVSTNHPDCNIVAQQSTSAVVSPTYVPATVSFKVPSAAELNDVNSMRYVQLFTEEMNAAMAKLAFELDGRAFTAADTARSQIFGDELALSFVGSPTFQLEVPSTERNSWLSQIVSSYRYSGLGSQINIVGSAGIQNTVEFIDNQGANNATNLQYQLGSGDISVDISSNISQGTDYAVGYAAARGSLATLTAIHRNSVNAMSLNEHDEWGIISNNPLGVPVGYHRQRTCESGTSGAEYFDSWTLTVYASFLTAWVNDPTTQQHPITKFVLK